MIALGAHAVSPVEDSPVHGSTPAPMLQRSARVALGAASTENRNTFFEGFEARPDGFGPYYDEWLPEGWQDVSKTGQEIPAYGVGHNLTWRVLNNENRTSAYMARPCYAFEGEAFAFIMSDVAYVGHTDLVVQDEWLITPAVTPQAEDWLYFKLFYSPSWSVYNRKTDSFDSRNTYLEVYASDDNEATWHKLWNVIDDEIKPKWSDDQLRADLIKYDAIEYTPIYVNLKDYVGKPIKLAFRFAGSLGHGVAIDNVAVGVPMPKPSYSLPEGFFKKGLSEIAEYPSEFSLIGPHNTKATWTNTSKDALLYQWNYAGATGAMESTDAIDLVTPEYPMGTVVSTPQLTASFESRVSDPFQSDFPKMQLGGLLRGTDTTGHEGEFSAGYYDIADPRHVLRISSEYLAMYSGTDLAWEKLLGKLDGSVDILAISNYFPAPEVPYGFDFADVAVYIKEPLSPKTNLKMTVCTLDQNGLPDKAIAVAVLNGADVPYSPDTYVNLRFRFPVPVYVDSEILVNIVDFNLEEDNIIFPYVRTTSEIYGNSLIYAQLYDPEIGSTDTFYNLNGFPVTEGHFAGILMNLGVSYSSMEHTGESTMELPAEGGSKEFKIKAHHGSDRWTLTEDGVTPVSWAYFAGKYDEATDTHTLTVTVEKNSEPEAREADLKLMSPGSYVTIHVSQAADTSGILGTEAGADTKVTTDENTITVLAPANEGMAEVYDLAGTLVASAAITDGKAEISCGHFASGVYFVRVQGAKVFKIVK